MSLFRRIKEHCKMHEAPLAPFVIVFNLHGINIYERPEIDNNTEII
jgi:hypothetical protein